MAREKAKAVKKTGGKYVAIASDGDELARASALNLFNEPSALTPDTELTFSKGRVWQQIGSAHKGGVLYIE